jgi:UDP-N-acetylglucosamine 1-carboxyvinyltransferase
VEDQLVVQGGGPLEGVLRVSGSKNGALPLLAATLLTESRCVLSNLPNLTDIETLLEILISIGLGVERLGPGTLALQVMDESNSVARYELVSKMRASIYALGPMLAKRGFARVSLPGGCVIGTRPVDLHLKGLRALGAEIEIDHGYVVARAPKGRLQGGHMFLGGPMGSSVGATANTVMAATLAEGKSVIEGAACEPEIVELIAFLNAMGATIEGAGTPRLVITGVPTLGGARQSVIPDRIEAGTYMMAVGLAGGDVKLEGVCLDHMSAVADTLRAAGIELIQEEEPDVVRVRRRGLLRPVRTTTLPYPGYPTDLQAQLVSLLTHAEGISVVTEKIYPERFMHVGELTRMGAQIEREGGSAVIHGGAHLTGADVTATDLRAGAALVLAGLVAEGETRVHDIFHVDRGYADIERKLRGIGASIHRSVVSASYHRAA